MQQAEMIYYLIMYNAILLIFIIGLILFFLQFRNAKITFLAEKTAIQKEHQIDILNTRLEMQQQTMQHIGQEIHDSVGQKLTLAALYVQQLEFENKYPFINKNLKDIGSIVNDSLMELRELSKTLVDEQYDRTSLRELIELECARIKNAGICAMSFESNEDKIALSPTEKNVLLRIVQEFMQNSLKHASCSLISVRLNWDDSSLTIIAMDDGKGFDVDLVHSPGLGLNNMKRRAGLIGAGFELHSKEGSGTKMTLLLQRK
ncbi:MAG: ATP-binding protein [Chitinophagaceae bacterium]